MKVLNNLIEDCYFTGDGCNVDKDNYYWIKGRLDGKTVNAIDVINVSGYRLSTAEIEGAINKVNGITESAVIGIPDSISGECVYAYVVCEKNFEKMCVDTNVKQGIQEYVKQIIGAIASPKHIRMVKELPKTRSGKIMRRILRKIAINKNQDLGDLSTLINPEYFLILQ